MFRVSLERVIVERIQDYAFCWRVRKCWRVDPRWASRPVDLDRRGPVLLRVLSPERLIEGEYPDPRSILGWYLASLSMEVKLRRELEMRAAA